MVGIDALLGNIGSVDVQDMHQAITDITTKYSNIVNINQLCIVGGSHGGFLTGHMIGQYPTMFKAACMRNPVTNIPSMVGVTGKTFTLSPPSFSSIRMFYC